MIMWFIYYDNHCNQRLTFYNMKSANNVVNIIVVYSWKILKELYFHKTTFRLPSTSSRCPEDPNLPITWNFTVAAFSNEFPLLPLYILILYRFVWYSLLLSNGRKSHWIVSNLKSGSFTMQTNTFLCKNSGYPIWQLLDFYRAQLIRMTYHKVIVRVHFGKPPCN